MEVIQFAGIEYNRNGEPCAIVGLQQVPEDDDGYGDAARLLMDCDFSGDKELDFEEDL